MEKKMKILNKHQKHNEEKCKDNSYVGGLEKRKLNWKRKCQLLEKKRHLEALQISERKKCDNSRLLVSAVNEIHSKTDCKFF